MKISNIFLYAALVMIFTSTICTATGNHNPLKFNIFAAYGYFDYREISNKIEEFHKLDAIDWLPNAGIDVEYSFSRFFIKNQISYSSEKLKKKHRNRTNSFSFREIQDQLKIGCPVINNKHNRFFPFAGILFQYQSIKADFNYYLKCPSCFFQYNHDYDSFTIGIIYGASYEQSLFSKYLKLGVDVGGVIPVQNKLWWFNGKKIETKEYVPGSNFQVFANLKLVLCFNN